MAKKEKEVSAQVKQEAQDVLKRTETWLETQKGKPVDQKEVDRRLKAMFYDFEHWCKYHNVHPFDRLKTFENLGYFVK